MSFLEKNFKDVRHTMITYPHVSAGIKLLPLTMTPDDGFDLEAGAGSTTGVVVRRANVIGVHGCPLIK